jgi:hypothetical protein
MLTFLWFVGNATFALNVSLHVAYFWSSTKTESRPSTDARLYPLRRPARPGLESPDGRNAYLHYFDRGSRHSPRCRQSSCIQDCLVESNGMRTVDFFFSGLVLIKHSFIRKGYRISLGQPSREVLCRTSLRFCQYFYQRVW